MFPGSGGFDCCIQCQQIGTVCHILDHLDNRPDIFTHGVYIIDQMFGINHFFSKTAGCLDIIGNNLTAVLYCGTCIKHNLVGLVRRICHLGSG